jgi:hypothetical protein
LTPALLAILSSSGAQQTTPFGQLFLDGFNAYAVRFPNRTALAALAAPAAQYDGERR